MKNKKIFSLIVACILTGVAATADVYHDGLKSLIDNGMDKNFSRQQLEEVMIKEGKTAKDVDKIIDKTVDLIAPYYRQNFTEERFKQFLQFYSQPELIEVQQKIAMANAIVKNTNQTNLIKVMMQIQSGKTPSDIFPLPCSTEYDKAFVRYWKMSNMDETLDYLLALLELSTAAQPNDNSGKGKEQQQTLHILIDYFKSNYQTLIRNSMIDVVSEQDLLLYTSAMDQPFYPNLMKVQESLTNDIPNFLTNVVELMGEEESNNSKQNPTSGSTKPAEQTKLDGVSTTPTAKAPIDNTPNGNDEVFVIVETMPEFPGGPAKLNAYLSQSIRHPQEVQKYGFKGRAICQFIVEKDGTITNAEVVRSSGNMVLDHEALRVIKGMPKWKPGYQHGKPVRVKYTIPVNFNIPQPQK